MPATLFQKLKKSPMRLVLLALTAPIIYGMFFVFVLADLCASVYQAACFPVYGIPKVRRRDYVVIDRGKLAYLRFMDKLNCLYCEYANGVVAFAGEVIARTEWYWCPIKHEKEVIHPHDHYHKFIPYGDGENYRAKIKAVRKRRPACESCACAAKGVAE